MCLGLVIVYQGAFLNLWVVGVVFRRVIPSGDFKLALVVAAVYFAFRLSLGGLGIWLRQLSARLIDGVIGGLKTEQMDAILRGYDGTKTTQDVRTTQSALSIAMRQLKESLSVLIDQTLPSIATLVAIMALIAIKRIDLLLYLLGLLLMFFILMRTSGYGIYLRLKSRIEAEQAYNSHFSFVFHFLDLIRMRRMEEYEGARYAGRLADLHTANNRIVRAMSIQQFVLVFFQSLIFVVALVIGTKTAMDGDIDMGGFVVLLLSLSLLFNQFSNVLNGYSKFLLAGESLKTLKDLSAAMKGPDVWKGVAAMPRSGSFVFRDVGFTYTGKPVFRNLDLTIGAGSFIGLVGENGAGKTTLLHLLMGLLRPTSGSISSGGVELSEIDMTDYRRSIGYVPQKPRLMPGSVRENLVYGHTEGVSDEQLFEALRLSMADGIVGRLENGLDTSLGEEGVRLSGGERQRLAIAAAMLGSPRILIMDEPTNHLDVDAINRLIGTLKRLPDGPTVLIATHNREILSHVDRILLLRDGDLQEVALKGLSQKRVDPMES